MRSNVSLESCSLAYQHKTYLTEMICVPKHIVHWAPAYIAMEGDLQWGDDSTVDLQLVEVLNALAWCLNLHRKHAYCRDNIKRSSQDMVVGQIWVIFPYSARCLHSTNLGYMAHDRDIAKVNDMCQTPVQVSFNSWLQVWNVCAHQLILLRIPFLTPAFMYILNNLTYRGIDSRVILCDCL